MCLKFELFKVDMDGELKNKLEDKINRVSAKPEEVSIKIAMVHWSDWEKGSIKIPDESFDLVLFFSQDEFPRPIGLSGKNKQGWSDREWGVPTRILIEYFDELVEHLKLDTTEWRVDAWIPRRDRMNAWAILCQGYMAAHDSGVAQLTQDVVNKTEGKAWWLGPVLTGTDYDNMTITYKELCKLFDKEMKGVGWKWNKMKELMKKWSADRLEKFVEDFNKQFNNLRPPCTSLDNARGASVRKDKVS